MCDYNQDRWLDFERLHGSYEALKYGSTLDGLADLTGGVTESLSVRANGSLNVRLLSRLLVNTSILTAVVQANPSNKENHNSVNSINSNGQKTPPSANAARSTIDRLPNGILVGINYKICSIEKVGRTSIDSESYIGFVYKFTSIMLMIGKTMGVTL